MKTDLVQLIKDRCNLVENNIVVSKILKSYLKDSYTSKIIECNEYSFDLSNGISIRIVNNDIFIENSDSKSLLGEDMRLTINNNSFILSYINNIRTNDKYIIQSFRLYFINKEIVSADIGEYQYGLDVKAIKEYIDNTILNLQFIHSDYYKQLKLYIVNDIYENMRILPDNYKELAFDVTSNKALFNVNDSSEEEEYTGNVFDLIYQFGNISLDNSNNTQMVNIILQINNLLEKEKDYTPKERQYILLNNRKIKRDGN